MLRFKILAIAALLLVSFAEVQAQTDRNLIRQGNRAFRGQKWAASETQYRKAISKNGKNPQAIYNLGCALLMQQKDSAAMVQFEHAAKLEPNKLRRAKSYHNMGVVMQQHREYAQAIGCYENALRCNPSDNETRYNLVLCKKLQKDNKQNDKNKQQNQSDKNKDKDNKDKQEKQKDKSQKKDKQQQNQPQMSKENAEQLLNAAMQQERETKERLNRSRQQQQTKRLEKNW